MKATAVEAARVGSTTMEAVIVKSAMEVVVVESVIEVPIMKSAVETSADEAKAEPIVVRPPVVPVGRVLNGVAVVGHSRDAVRRGRWGSASST
jgi:hypothetical protein